MSVRDTASENEWGHTASGRRVRLCYCWGGTAHEHKPHGGGMRIMACPSEPLTRAERIAQEAAATEELQL